MQNRYAGDIGDFGKFALLRALSPGRTLGVCWYFNTGEGETNNDGGHTEYLQRPDRFRALDYEVFDAFDELTRGERSVAALERTGLLAASAWHRSPVPRGKERDAWFAEAVTTVDACELVFADPDNGIADKEKQKHISMDEICKLRREGRALLVYQHQSRMKGGAPAVARDLAQRARQLGFNHVDVIRMKPYVSRSYFLFDADEVLRAKLRGFAAKWGGDAELIDVSTPP